MTGERVPAEVLERARSLAVERLSPARLRHVEGVVQTAVRLARRYGEDPDRLALAGWLHDLARELGPAELLERAERYGWEPDDAERADPLLLHGPVAAAEARAVGLTDDEEVLEAVRWHTTARPGLGRVGCLLFLADKIEPGRRYPGVAELRRLAETDWGRAMLVALENSIRHCLDRGYWLPAATVAARNEWLTRAGTRRPEAKSSG
ncbi:MAG: phosphohydrolase [Bacillota bacterium]|nr:MAG: phosphohydrolase [Bacillota bacterium]